MKYIKKFENEYYKNSEVKYNKLTYSQAGEAWNELWKNLKFKYPSKHTNILITCNYYEDDDIGLFEVLKYNNNQNQFISLGKKYLRGIPEDRAKFIQWLDELNIIIKKTK